MARIFNTTTDIPSSSATDKHHIYNGLDCCMTFEIWEKLLPQLDEITGPVYRNAIDLQGPIMEMQCRGILVDKERIAEVAARLSEQLLYVENGLDELLIEGLDLEPINPHSWQQVSQLLYKDIGLPPVYKMGKPVCDRKALEKLRNYFYAEPIINHILKARDLKKKIGVLRTPVDPDGRMRTSYSIAGTDTGRFSSRSSCFGSGTNLQNVTSELREIFIADPGMKFAYIDLKQAEDFAVGAICWNRFHAAGYLDACESGDLHTGVASMTFKHLPFNGEPEHDRELADQNFYRELSYRDSCKRLGHGTKYYGKAPHMAKETRIPLPMVEDFQKEFFLAFPEIKEWHAWTKSKLHRDGWITSLMNRRRWFFGRRYDDETLRAAIAYDPQGSVADIISLGIQAIHNSNLPVQLLLQVHDALLVQYPEKLEDEILPQVTSLIEVEIPLLHNRTLKIPAESAVGWNWGYAHHPKTKEIINRDGLIKFKGTDKRSRSAALSLMDRRFHNINLRA